MNGFYRINRVVDVIADYPVEVCLIYRVKSNDDFNFDFTIETYEGDFGLLSMSDLVNKVHNYVITNKQELIELYNNRKVISEK